MQNLKLRHILFATIAIIILIWVAIDKSGSSANTLEIIMPIIKRPQRNWSMERPINNVVHKDKTAQITYLKPTLPVSCDLLFKGDETEREKVREMLDKWNNSISDDDFLNSLISCSTIVPTFNNNFYTSKEEKQFPLAFVILIYYENHSIQQYIRLLRFLYRPHNIYCLHIDQKAPQYWIQAITQFTSCFDNILLAQKAVEVVYSSPSILTAHLACLEELTHSDMNWQYSINLHGTELPLVTNKEMVQTLKRLQGLNVVTQGKDVSKFGNKTLTYRRITHKTVYIPGEGMMISNEVLGPIPYNLTIFKSADSPNGAFSRDFVHFMLTSPKAVALFEYLQNVHSSLEFFFSTVNNIPEAPGGHNVFLRTHPHPKLPAITSRIWRQNDTNASLCNDHFYRHKICIVSSSDLPNLKNKSEQGSQFFHNKYLIDYDHVVMDCMEQILLQRIEIEWKIDLL